jgi:CheY-like chemotaxis protein
VGISKETHERIFESFIQEEVASTRGHEGSGLGLSVVKGLLKLLGGSVRLESVKGEGSSFFVTIPCERLSQLITADEGEITVTHSPGSPVILIVEDDDSNRGLLEIILSRHVKRLLLAINGKEAVEICRNHPEVSLVLMDIKMPVMNGYEATRAIKSFRKDLPVIAITAFAMSSDEQLARDAGCDDYISKPVSMSSLKERLKKFGIEL